MKKIIIFVILAILLLGAVVSYNTYIRNAISGFRDEFEVVAVDTKNLHFIHWGNFPIELFGKFTEKHPDLNVIFEGFDEDYYPTLQKIRIASGSEIDVMGIMENDFDDFVRKGYLVNLSDSQFLGNYNSDVRDAVKKLSDNKNEYAVAYRRYVYGVWYNKILFSRYNVDIPGNYDEFLQVCDKFKRNGLNPLILGARDDYAASYVYFLRILSILEEDANRIRKLEYGEAKWTDPDMISAFKDVDSFIDAGYLADDSKNLTYHQAFLEFTRGHAAMIIMGDWSLNLIKGDTEKVCEPGVFPIPYVDSGETSKAAGSKTGLLTGIFSESKHIEEAELLIEYLSTAEAAQLYSDIGMAVPTVEGVDISRLKFNELWDPLRKADQVSPGISEMSHEIRKKFNKSAKELIIGNKSYLEVLNELQALQDSMSNGSK